MFTGLVEKVGRVVSLEKTSEAYELVIDAGKLAEKLSTGDSVAVNGVCLTVMKNKKKGVKFHVLEETMRCTNLHTLAKGSRVNLERAVTMDRPMGGHFVQGHVDCTAKMLAYEPEGADYRLEVEVPADFRQYVAYKGSISINGISLTVAEVKGDSMVIWIVTHTHENTNLPSLEKDSPVNLEFDMLAKYVERILEVREAGQKAPGQQQAQA
jgi:riboflavin synthase